MYFVFSRESETSTTIVEGGDYTSAKCTVETHGRLDLVSLRKILSVLALHHVHECLITLEGATVLPAPSGPMTSTFFSSSLDACTKKFLISENIIN